jgi:hypothetical protein
MDGQGSNIGVLNFNDWRGEGFDLSAPVATREEMLTSFADAVGHLTRAVSLIEAKNLIIQELEAEIAELRHKLRQSTSRQNDLRRIIGTGRQWALAGER